MDFGFVIEVFSSSSLLLIRMSGKGICGVASLAEVVDPEAVSYMNWEVALLLYLYLFPCYHVIPSWSYCPLLGFVVMLSSVGTGSRWRLADTNSTTANLDRYMKLLPAVITALSDFISCRWGFLPVRRGVVVLWEPGERVLTSLKSTILYRYRYQL